MEATWGAVAALRLDLGHCGAALTDIPRRMPTVEPREEISARFRGPAYLWPDDLPVIVRASLIPRRIVTRALQCQTSSRVAPSSKLGSPDRACASKCLHPLRRACQLISHAYNKHDFLRLE